MWSKKSFSLGIYSCSWKEEIYFSRLCSSFRTRSSEKERETRLRERRIRMEDGVSSDLLHPALLFSPKHLPNWYLTKLRIVSRRLVLNVSWQLLLQLSKPLCSLDGTASHLSATPRHYKFESKKREEKINFKFIGKNKKSQQIFFEWNHLPFESLFQ